MKRPRKNFFVTPHYSGQDASPGLWPWMASLWYPDETGVLKILCGGTLISGSHVLTAAHCVADLDKDLVQIALGDTDFR